jgi:A/G-specific adenine glycosylase
MAQELMDEKNPAVYNQAIMDFGAVVCKPQQPICERCPLKKKCVAFNEGLQSSIPRKSPKTKAQVRYLNYLILEHKGRQLVRKRSGNDIWKDLYELIDVSDEIIHQLTHRKIICRLVHIKIEQPIKLEGYDWKSKTAIRQLPFPRLFTRYLKW